MAILKLTDRIGWLQAGVKPLSCDVIFIKGTNATWIFDVGMNGEAAVAINNVAGEKNIVLSHFHPDHILNLPKVSYSKLFVSKNTKKYVFKGEVVQNALHFEDGLEISILEMPSSHAKGCLCLVCGDYAFLGDGAFCKPIKGHHFYNAQLLLEMIRFMEKLDVKYFCLSHEKHFVQEKWEVINLYREIYKRRKEGNPFISVEDFF